MGDDHTMAIDDTFRRNLRSGINESGLSVRAWARRHRLSDSTVYAHLSGDKTPTLSYVADYARALRVSVPAFLSDADSQVPTGPIDPALLEACIFAVDDDERQWSSARRAQIVAALYAAAAAAEIEPTREHLRAMLALAA